MFTHAGSWHRRRETLAEGVQRLAHCAETRSNLTGRREAVDDERERIAIEREAVADAADSLPSLRTKSPGHL
ncbi:hypothetical protein BJY24_005610 [Nocardia transvalensis]|uniref:Uncharacterized protein n=1 Tax=Nocardia transvalensis TaxID=37333 RepID=A0A7W9UKL9_9NOCA|nr:hypothetical protein [Nocardia transvalensis]MBB5916698.1 hypothetical protein [Nocardia transvalensis]